MLKYFTYAIMSCLNISHIPSCMLDTHVSSFVSLTGVCTYDWTAYADMNAAGSIPQRDITVTDCQSRCINNPLCVGIDIDNTPNAIFCYLTFQNVTLMPFIGVNHYQLTRSLSCPEMSEFRLSNPMTRITHCLVIRI